MKITICTSGRFHVADLARELIALGHDVILHSIVPPGRLLKFGIPLKNQRCYLGWVFPFIFAQRKLRFTSRSIESLDNLVLRILDRRFSRISMPGEVFIGMSGLCLKSIKAAKEKEARTILERGSRHILSQKEILDGLPSNVVGKSLISDRQISRELLGYELADVISIPSKHVEESFIERGITKDKLFRNPYGVDLKSFSSFGQIGKEYDVIMTGTWSYRKGCNVLSRAVLDILGLKLLHIGSIGDCPLPTHPGFIHVDSVEQKELPRYYGKAKVFAMPSFEEGLSTVQAQALACGLPIVGSTCSGSVDLSELLELDSPAIQSVVPGDSVVLAEKIKTALDWVESTDYKSSLLGNRENLLDWAAYGNRYSNFLQEGVTQSTT